ncbi:MAG: class I SAM-dependent methyltransferase [Okeania sp. SIO3I5]|uniref:class I SAM-dependent DNA methyltransferase n=1 Tax=Okeania sp. SIO3I5 TaxID=2607805 RepID=UPI0013BA0703|nr:class I SAM-dependent methyltransferase [Okeania sp. SIO3I5]NEQ39906.1 class I SAM-dependent methyltransferase [Okeania sp. SIO3I5]
MVNKISATEFYDDLAAKYDDWLTNSKYNVQHVNEAVKIFQRYNYTQGSVLDMGCGTGLLSELLQGDFEYTGIDISVKMLDYAAKRGYRTINKSFETALPEIDDNSYDFIFCLSSLVLFKDAQTTIEQMERIARQAILISLDEVTEEFIKNFAVPVYDHSKITIKNATEDYYIAGWISKTTGIPIQTRMIFIKQNS